MLKQKTNNVQEWLPLQEFYNDGIIKLKSGKFIKIIKILPINYDLKSEFEKKAILNSYKAFLKNCNFKMQIIIKSNKEDISENINKLNIQKEKERRLNNNIIVNKSDLYINYIKNKNKEKLSSSKNFYIIIESNKINEKAEESVNIELKEKYFKIKDCLSRCGNTVYEIKEESELKKIIISFFIK